jgi:phage gpG-like protein
MVGSAGVVYAAIHEFGGTIRPLRAKNLAIPTTKEARKAGSPRSMTDLKWIPGNGRVSYLVNDDGVQYVLVKSVQIPARPYLRPAYKDNKDKIQKAIGSSYSAEIARVSK